MVETSRRFRHSMAKCATKRLSRTSCPTIPRASTPLYSWVPARMVGSSSRPGRLMAKYAINRPGRTSCPTIPRASTPWNQKWPPWVGATKGVRIDQPLGGRLAIFTWRSKNEKVGYGYGNEWVARFYVSYTKGEM